MPYVNKWNNNRFKTDKHNRVFHMDDVKIQETLTPHSYPLWIQVSSATCFLFLMIGLTDLPYYFKINNMMKNADKAFRQRNFHDASLQFEFLVLLLPSNKYVHIRAAESFFKSSLDEDHLLALSLLKSISLKKNEWKELLEYMPEQYIAMFEDKRAS